MKSETFYCTDCKQHKPTKRVGGTGYAELDNGDKVCYACCGVRDAEHMKRGEKIILYLETACDKYRPYASGHVINWPNTLRIPCTVKRGGHNIAGCRYDVWFNFGGRKWWGVVYGEMQTCCHCQPLKQKVFTMVHEEVTILE